MSNSASMRSERGGSSPSAVSARKVPEDWITKQDRAFFETVLEDVAEMPRWKKLLFRQKVNNLVIQFYAEEQAAQSRAESSKKRRRRDDDIQVVDLKLGNANVKQESKPVVDCHGCIAHHQQPHVAVPDHLFKQEQNLFLMQQHHQAPQYGQQQFHQQDHIQQYAHLARQVFPYPPAPVPTTCDRFEAPVNPSVANNAGAIRVAGSGLADAPVNPVNASGVTKTMAEAFTALASALGINYDEAIAGTSVGPRTVEAPTATLQSMAEAGYSSHNQLQHTAGPTGHIGRTPSARQGAPATVPHDLTGPQAGMSNSRPTEGARHSDDFPVTVLDVKPPVRHPQIIHQLSSEVIDLD